MLFKYMFLFLLHVAVSRNAIEYFIKNKKINNFTVQVVKSLEDNHTNWIEYKYIFSTNYLNLVNLNRTLKVGIVKKKENQFDCRWINKRNQTLFKGYSYDVINSLKDRLNFSIETNILEDSTVIDKLTKNTIDCILCHPNTIETTPEITELYPTIKSNMVLIYKPTKLHFTKDIFILTFAGWLWTAFLATLILLAICLRISTIKYATIPPKYEQWTWVEITLWAIAAACQQGLSHTPSGFASCCIFFLGYLMAYLLYTGFAAAITSILVQHDIESNADLKNIDIASLRLVSLQSSRLFLGNFQDQFIKRIFVNSLDKLFKELEKDDTVGVASEMYINQYIANQLTYEQASQYLQVKLGIHYRKGLLIARNNPWKKLLNQEILRMDQLGLLQNMLKRNLRSTQIPDVNTGYSSAGPEHVRSAILLFLAGILISIMFLLTEIVYYLYKKSRKNLGL